MLEETKEEREARIVREYNNATIEYDRAARLAYRSRRKYHAKLARRGKDAKRVRRLEQNQNVAYGRLREKYNQLKGG